MGIGANTGVREGEFLEGARREPITTSPPLLFVLLEIFTMYRGKHSMSLIFGHV